MTAETRESVELDDVKPRLVQKLESYLRAHFDGKSAGVAGDALERLLFQVGMDWLVNRGLPADTAFLADAVREAAARYRENWAEKEQGEDDRSRSLGRPLRGGPKGYAV